MANGSNLDYCLDKANLKVVFFAVSGLKNQKDDF